MRRALKPHGRLEQSLILCKMAPEACVDLPVTQPVPRYGETGLKGCGGDRTEFAAAASVRHRLVDAQRVSCVVDFGRQTIELVIDRLAAAPHARLDRSRSVHPQHLGIRRDRGARSLAGR